MEIKTLGDLKSFLNTLNDDQLKERAGVFVTDSHFELISSGEITQEDHFLTDEGFAPISTFSPEDDGNLEDFEIQKSGFPSLHNE